MALLTYGHPVPLTPKSHRLVRTSTVAIASLLCGCRLNRSRVWERNDNRDSWGNPTVDVVFLERPRGRDNRFLCKRAHAYLHALAYEWCERHNVDLDDGEWQHGSDLS